MLEQHFVHVPLVDRQTMRASIVEALACRALGKPAAGAAQQYMSLKLVDLARLCAGRDGQKMAIDTLLNQTFSGSGGAHGSTDFPLLLQDAANKVLEQALSVSPPSYRAWASRRPFKDFKPHKFLRVGDFPAFTSVPEPATVAFGTVSENREQVSLISYTSGISFTREALVNDDLGALASISTSIAARASNCENELAYSVLASNPLMADGEALFSEAHGNLAAVPSTIDVANVAIAVQAMRNQTTLDGLPMNLAPKYLICGPARELKARQLVSFIAAPDTESVNPYGGALEVVVDSNISGNEWFLCCDPARLASIVYGHLNGAESAEVWVARDLNTRSLRINAGLDFGVGAIDYRGVYKNAGA